MSILTDAEELINGDRAAAYGSPLAQYTHLAGMLNAYLGTEMTWLDAINVMLLVKVNRVRSEMGWHRDSYADIAGYAGCAEKAHNEEQGDPLAEWEKELLAEKPRQWDSLQDVPHDVRVTDGSSPWRHTGSGWVWGCGCPDDDDYWIEATHDLRQYRGPFTEILGG